MAIVVWMRRVTSLLRRAPGHVLIVAPETSAGDIIVNGFTRRGAPSVRMRFDATTGADDVLYGNRLADALEEALGFRLFGYGVPLSYGLAVLRSQLHLVGRITITIVGAGNAPQDLIRPLFDSDPRQVQVVASFHRRPDLDPSQGYTLLDSTDLAMTKEEAKDCARSVLPDETVEKVWSESRGAYLNFIERVNRMTLLPPIVAPSAGLGAEVRSAPEHLTMYVRQGRWLEALETAIAHGLPEAMQIFRQGAPMMMDQGLHERLWTLLEDMDPSIFEADEELMYLYYSVATGANEHLQVAPRVYRFLEEREAPDLRARWAVANPDSSSLHEAERAYAARKNVNTARALGFVLTMDDQPVRAAEVLKEALEIAEATGDGRQVCATAQDISHALSFLGRYSSAKSWAQWGLEQYRKYEVGDELLRLSLTNLVAYFALLTDELGAAEGALATVALPEELLGTPMTEGFLSTLGDVAYVRDDLDAALEAYRTNFEHYPRSSLGLAALDLVKLLVRRGEPGDAATLLRQTGDVSGRNGTGNTLALTVAEGHLAFADGDYGRAIEHYSGVVHTDSTAGAPFATQAVIGLAVAHFRNGEQRHALEVLDRQRHLWRELGETGWTLMTIDRHVALELRAIVQDDEASARIKCLGERQLIEDGVQKPLSLRTAEIAVLLSLRPDGYKSDALLLDLYGDEGNRSSLKALISRARVHLSIASQPYRFAQVYRCDFLELERQLERGRLREALELYQGPLLPESEAPGVRQARERIDEAVRQAVLHAGEWDLVLRLARKLPDDLELWEEAGRLVPKNDPAYPLIRAQVRRIRGEWGM